MNPHFLTQQLEFNTAYAQELVRELEEEEMVKVPFPGLENHPAFTLGHIVTSRALVVKYLGGTYQIPRGWDELFRRNGPGDPRLPVPSSDTDYPTKESLLSEMKKQQKLIVKLLSSYDDWTSKKEWRFDTFMPSKLDCLVFMCVNHEAMHLGQLAAWRRAMQLPSALGRL